jgi:N-glycosidase YbiA
MGKDSSVLGFTHDHFFLSNFFPCKIEFEGSVYPTTENAFQAAKFPAGLRARFQDCTARSAKQLGRAPMPQESLKEWDAGRKVWVMLEVNMAKYLWGDTYWGICNDKGLNMLGRILMEIREYIRSFWRGTPPTRSELASIVDQLLYVATPE